MKTTDELEHEIRQSTDILDYLERNSEEMQLDSLPNYLSKWLEKKLHQSRCCAGFQSDKSLCVSDFFGTKISVTG